MSISINVDGLDIVISRNNAKTHDYVRFGITIISFNKYGRVVQTRPLLKPHYQHTILELIQLVEELERM